MNIYIILISITILLLIMGIILGLYQERLIHTSKIEQKEESKNNGLDDLDEII